MRALGAGCETEEIRERRPVAIRSDEHRFTAALPAGWELAARSLTPDLLNPLEILSAGTVRGLRRIEGESGNVPLAVLERMREQDVFVTVQESHGNAGFRERPAHFTLPAKPAGSEPSLWAARHAGRLDVHWFDFHDSRREFYVLVAVGRDARPSVGRRRWRCSTHSGSNPAARARSNPDAI